MKSFRILAVVLTVAVSNHAIAGVDDLPPMPTVPMKGVDLSKSAEIDWPAHTAIYPVTEGTFKDFLIRHIVGL